MLSFILGVSFFLSDMAGMFFWCGRNLDFRDDHALIPFIHGDIKYQGNVKIALNLATYIGPFLISLFILFDLF